MGFALSVERLLLAEENELKQLRKKKISLLKKVAKEQLKLQSFSAELQRHQTESAGRVMAIGDSFLVASKRAYKALKNLSEKPGLLATEQRILQQMMDELLELVDYSPFPFTSLDLEDNIGDEESKVQGSEKEKFDEDQFRSFFEDNFFEDEEGFGFKNSSRFGANDTSCSNRSASAVEKRRIRAVYIRLVSQYHPDRASDEKTRCEFETVVKELNTAYRRDDIATLLKLERQLESRQNSKSKKIEPSAFQAVLERELAQLREEVALCETQLHRVKQDKRRTERSASGREFKEFQKSVSRGINPLDEDLQAVSAIVAKIDSDATLFEAAANGKAAFKKLIHRFKPHYSSRKRSMTEEEILQQMLAEFFEATQQRRSNR